MNPPLNIAGMALIVVDASGRLAEFIWPCPRTAEANAGRHRPPRSTGRCSSPPPRWTCQVHAGGPALGAGHVRRPAMRLGGANPGASRPEVQSRGGDVGGKPVSFSWRALEPFRAHAGAAGCADAVAPS